MKLDDKAKQVLGFEPPQGPLPQDFAQDEKNCVGFLAKVLDRYRALRTEFEAKAQESQRYWQEKEDLQGKLEGFLVRNLIPIMDECKLALETGGPAPEVAGTTPAAEQPPAPSEPADPMATMVAQPVVFTLRAPAGAEPAIAQPASPADAGEPQLGMASFFRRIERQVMSLLNGLGIERVELLGKTYETVVLDGETIAAPFGIDESDKGGGNVVSKVIDDLWVRRRYGTLQVVRKGRVVC